MNTNEAVRIVRNLAESLTENPNQFNFVVNAKAVGQSIVNHGGTGLSVTATGGAPGSTTIGNKISVSSGDVQIAITAAQSAIDDQMKGLVKALNEIVVQLESDKPDKGLIESILGSFKETWVPQIITTVVSTVVGLLLG